jgi:hypothetical protein
MMVMVMVMVMRRRRMTYRVGRSSFFRVLCLTRSKSLRMKYIRKG